MNRAVELYTTGLIGHKVSPAQHNLGSNSNKLRKPSMHAQLTVAVGGVGNAIQARRIADDLFAAVVVLSQRLYVSVGDVRAGGAVKFAALLLIIITVVGASHGRHRRRGACHSRYRRGGRSSSRGRRR